LDSNDVFILDAGYEVFAWIGSKSSVPERKKALQYAQYYLAKSGLPAWLPVSRILEGGENEAFESFFVGKAPLPQPSPASGPSKAAARSKAVNPLSAAELKADCETLFSAMKGFGTNDDKIILIFGSRSREQLLAIRDNFAAMYSKNLSNEIKSETSFNFRTVLQALCNHHQILDLHIFSFIDISLSCCLQWSQ
jgi:hypothetical protein